MGSQLRQIMTATTDMAGRIVLEEMKEFATFPKRTQRYSAARSTSGSIAATLPAVGRAARPSSRGSARSA
jgi:TctA family transporter